MMNLRPVAAGALCIGFAMAQTSATPDLKLRGDRFKPLKYETLDPAQKKMADHLLGGERGGANGPFNVMMRSPEMGDLAQQLGAQVRFHSTLPQKLNEFAIIITGRYWTAQYEWLAHKRLALTAGLKPEIVEAVAEGKRPAGMQADEEAVYNFSTELLNTKHVGDATYKAMVDKFGERGVVDLTFAIGYYQLVSSLLNVDRYPMAAGDKPELKELTKK
jgi:4-carboxymuconolactone decarboxylase